MGCGVAADEEYVARGSARRVAPVEGEGCGEGARGRAERPRRHRGEALAALAAAEIAHRLEVHVEVVRGGAQRARDGPRILRRHLLERGAHLLGQLHPAAAAERGADRLVEITTRAVRLLGQTLNLLLAEVHDRCSPKDYRTCY